MDEKEIKSLERRARALMASRAISPARMDVVHSLMQNESLAPGERYLAIIDLIKNNPEKKVKRTEKDSRIRNRRQQAPEACSDIKRGATREDVSDLYAPTESFRYIGDILRRYGHLKLFKIRYLVHRNNRFGIGFKKRIIPSKRLVKIFNDLWERQNAVADRLSRVMTDLLEDPSERSPQAFNYLRIISKWLLTAPLVKYRYDEIKWMERVHFEREFRSYAMKYFSIKKIDPLLKEALIEKVEERIRLHGDPGMAEGGKKQIQREKAAYQYMTLLRAFLSTVGDEDLPLSKMLKDNYGIKNLSELLIMVMEALVFQRLMGSESMLSYWSIEPPAVSETDWDYADDLLKKYGKDQDSLRGDRFTQLQEELAPLETLSMLLHADESGENLIVKGADEHWRLIDKKHYNPRLMYTEDFFSFLESAINFFYKTYVPFIDGTKFIFKDTEHREWDSPFFSRYYFDEDINRFNSILNEIHHFRSSNPSMAVTWKEVKQMMEGRNVSPSHTWRFIITLGDLFYGMGKRLQLILDKHKLWIYNGKVLKDPSVIRHPLEPAVIETEDESKERPLPFYECTITDGPRGPLLDKNVIGRRILNDAMNDGIYIKLTAFCFQVAGECFNKKILSDMTHRKDLLAELKKLEK